MLNAILIVSDLSAPLLCCIMNSTPSALAGNFFSNTRNLSKPRIFASKAAPSLFFPSSSILRWSPPAFSMPRSENLVRRTTTLLLPFSRPDTVRLVSSNSSDSSLSRRMNRFPEETLLGISFSTRMLYSIATMLVWKPSPKLISSPTDQPISASSPATMIFELPRMTVTGAAVSESFAVSPSFRITVTAASSADGNGSASSTVRPSPDTDRTVVSWNGPRRILSPSGIDKSGGSAMLPAPASKDVVPTAAHFQNGALSLCLTKWWQSALASSSPPVSAKSASSAFPYIEPAPA
mmetsp:Transcript_27505/g.55034  ORF Transcript_27505/g.55034 Transcript_27505/m.55034 type:complete len:293 (+) Transcript_27505:1912-2790(+)